MLTTEQKYIVDTVMLDILPKDVVILVNAIAGSGKTTTAKGIVEAYRPKSGVYTAFNKAIVQDSAKRFGHLLDCRTLHSLAYKYVKPKHVIEQFNYASIEEKIDYTSKDIVITTLDNFYLSDSTDLYDYLDNVRIPPKLKDIVAKYAEQMQDGKTNPSFNYLLKCFHLLLANEDIHISKDMLILDEAQDTTAVALEIFKLIKANRKICLGDRYQNIYQFMNTVNAFDKLENDPNIDTSTYYLTQSFRCMDNIAEIVEHFGCDYLNKEFKYRGVSHLPDKQCPDLAYLSRTNALLINRMIELLNEGTSFSTTRGIKEIFALPEAIMQVMNSQPINSSEFRFLNKAYTDFQKDGRFESFLEYLLFTIPSNPAVKTACNLIKNLQKRNIDLNNVRDKVTQIKPNQNIVLSTAFTFKGLEANSVIFENDLNTDISKITTLDDTIKGVDKGEQEIKNLYYVALSRARKQLSNTIYKKR